MMISQTSAVIDIFAHKRSANNIARAATLPITQRELHNLPLQVAQLSNRTSGNKLAAWLIAVLVIFAHAQAIYLLSTQNPPDKIQVKSAKPMLVSIIAPPAPEPQKVPELVPIIEPPKPEPKPIIKPKKVVKKIVPIEKPLERMVEATTEPPKEEVAEPEPKPEPVVAAVPVETPKAPEHEPVEEKEETIEPPKFGVSYLNNPAPEYPPMARRLGEEGRVLMKVLVSAAGAAEDVQIVKSCGSERLDNAAVNAVKRWRFIPARKNNIPLSAYVLVPMKFSLDS